MSLRIMTAACILLSPTLGCALLGVPETTARAESVPGDFAVEVSGGLGNIQVRDAASGEILLAQRNRILFSSGDPDGIRPQIDVRPRQTGFDLVYTYVNNAAAPQRLGTIQIGEFLLGDQISYRNFRWDGKEKQASRADPPQRNNVYPSSTYSPAFVMVNERYAVGVSVQYPIMEYRHECTFGAWVPDQGREPAQTPGWILTSVLSNVNRGENLPHPAILPPGESREYTLSIRFIDKPSEWIRTLTPYREHFRNLYGGVRYERNPNPVRAVTLSLPNLTSSDNPYGFRTIAPRPDRYGFAGWAAHLRDVGRDWRRMMLWNPSGVYRVNRQNNFPFQFTTNWVDGDPNGRDMRDAPEHFRSVADSGVTLGLWWGRSAQLMQSWDTPDYEDFDPGDPSHVEAAFRELDLAAEAGATMIGLDAFSHRHAPYWELAEWLIRMQERYPQMRFITESRKPDFMHALAPTFMAGYGIVDNPETIEDVQRIKEPFHLADFLLPGHETWIGMFPNRLAGIYGRMARPDEMDPEIRRVASLGYVPCVFVDDLAPVEEYEAARSWEFTVPEDLQIAIDPDGAQGPEDFGVGDGQSEDHGTGGNMFYSAPVSNRNGASQANRSRSHTRPLVRPNNTSRLIINKSGGAVVVPNGGRIVKSFDHDRAEKKAEQKRREQEVDPGDN